MESFVEFCNKYASVFTLVQTIFAALSFIAAIVAVILAVKAIKETRELSTKKELDIGGGIYEDDGHYSFQAAIYNTGYTAVNIQIIQIVNDDMAPLALGLLGGFGKKSFIQPQQFFQAEIPLSNYEETLRIESFRVEVIDVEDRVFSKEFKWAMG